MILISILPYKIEFHEIIKDNREFRKCIAYQASSLGISQIGLDSGCMFDIDEKKELKKT